MLFRQGAVLHSAMSSWLRGSELCLTQTVVAVEWSGLRNLVDEAVGGGGLVHPSRISVFSSQVNVGQRTSCYPACKSRRALVQLLLFSEKEIWLTEFGNCGELSLMSVTVITTSPG